MVRLTVWSVLSLLIKDERIQEGGSREEENSGGGGAEFGKEGAGKRKIQEGGSREVENLGEREEENLGGREQGIGKKGGGIEEGKSGEWEGGVERGGGVGREEVEREKVVRRSGGGEAGRRWWKEPSDIIMKEGVKQKGKREAVIKKQSSFWLDFIIIPRVIKTSSRVGNTSAHTRSQCTADRDVGCLVWSHHNHLRLYNL